MSLLTTMLTEGSSGGGGGGSGDVNGPSSSAANGLVSFNGTGGKTIQSQSHITTGANSTLTGGTTEDVIIASQNNHSIQLNPNGNGIVKAGSTVFAQASVPSGFVSLGANNTSTTGSGSLISAVVNGLSAGNAYYAAGNGSSTVSWGQNSSDASAYVVSMSNVLGSNNALRLGTDKSATFYGAATGMTTLTTTSTLNLNTNGDVGVSIFYDDGRNIITGNYGSLLFVSDNQQIDFGFCDISNMGDTIFENNDPANATATLTFTPNLATLATTSANSGIALTPTGSGVVAVNGTLSMASNKISSLATGVAATDAVNVAQLLSTAAISTPFVTVNLTSGTGQLVYTVPAGYNATVYLMQVQGLTTITGAPQMGLGITNPAYTDIINASPIAGALSSSSVQTFQPNPVALVAPAGTGIFAHVTATAAVGTVSVSLLVKLAPI